MNGPFFEDLEPGRIFISHGMTITEGHSAWFHSFAGDSNPVHLDDRIAQKIGLARAPLSTALLAHVAIGHSTVATHEVVANLLYSNVLFPRPVVPGVTLTTMTTVLARSEATPRPDRPPRGKVLLGISSVDDGGQTVVEMTRTALVLKASPVESRERAVVEPAVRNSSEIVGALGEWAPIASALSPLAPGWCDSAIGPDDLADPVVGALELVRVTGNLAKAHRDPLFGQNGRRLVYGGHTISIAQAALSRLIGGEHVVVGWESCHHPSPVFEEDLLSTAITEHLELGRLKVGSLTRLQTETTSGERDHQVQYWAPLVLAAES